jgi:hypothetical protein
MQRGRLVFLFLSCLTCTAFTLFRVFNLSMPSVKNVVPLLWISIASAQDNSIDLGWHEPKKTWINDLGKVLNGNGTYGFGFNGSQLPTGTPYGTYNWCNMPHVRSQEYPKASEDYKLHYVEV